MLSRFAAYALRIVRDCFANFEIGEGENNAKDED